MCYRITPPEDAFNEASVKAHTSQTATRCPVKKMSGTQKALRYTQFSRMRNSVRDIHHTVQVKVFKEILELRELNV